MFSSRLSNFHGLLRRGSCLPQSTSSFGRCTQMTFGMQLSSSSGKGDKRLPKLYLFTKEECSLCDVAKENLKPFMHRFELTEIDITQPGNKQWEEMYKIHIPVFHLEGVFISWHEIDLKSLEVALKKYEDQE